MTFADLVAGAEGTPAGFRLSVPPTWQQGRTAYGGFSTALAYRAALQLGGDLPPLRSGQVAFVGPLSGEIEVRAEVLRRGRNATWIEARVLKDGDVGLDAIFVFMGPVESAVHLNERSAPADLIAPEQATELANGFGPGFLGPNFDVRFAMPKAISKAPQLCWWVRPKEQAALDPMTALLLTADALPPGVMPLMTQMGNVSSMQWQFNLLTPAPVTRDGWWLLRSTGDYAEAGCSSQIMEVWNADGAPVCFGTQSIALFG